MTQSGKPKISVICVTYKHEKFIGDAINGFLRQKTNFPFEVLIGDDKSPDRTPEIVRQAAEQHPGKIIAVTREENIGAVPNFVDLISRAQGEYLCVCDGDDYWITDLKLQRQADFLDSNPDFSLCFHPVRIMYTNSITPPADVDPFSFFDESVRERGYFTMKELIKINFIASLSVMYRWQLGSNLPPWMVKYKIGDYPAHLIHAATGKIGILNEVMGIYRKHEDGSSWNPSRKSQREYLDGLMGLMRSVDAHLNYSYAAEFAPTFAAMQTELHRLRPNIMERALNWLVR